jgi:hypothetical protein
MKGLLMGQPHFDYTGIVTITCESNPNIVGTIDFFEEGRKGKSLGHFEGKITENGTVKHIIKGNWNQKLYITDPDDKNKIDLWTIDEEPFIQNKDYIGNYLTSEFTCNLNYLHDDLIKVLPPTDSRYRPDQRALENKQLELAIAEKDRIENNQRKRHKYFEEDKIMYQPNYFSYVLNTNNTEYVYIYKGDYWADRKLQNFDKLPKIFD